MHKILQSSAESAIALKVRYSNASTSYQQFASCPRDNQRRYSESSQERISVIKGVILLNVNDDHLVAKDFP